MPNVEYLFVITGVHKEPQSEKWTHVYDFQPSSTHEYFADTSCTQRDDLSFFPVQV